MTKPRKPKKRRSKSNIMTLSAEGTELFSLLEHLHEDLTSFDGRIALLEVGSDVEMFERKTRPMKEFACYG